MMESADSFQIKLGDWNHNPVVKERFKEVMKEISTNFMNAENYTEYSDYGPDEGFEEFRSNLAKFLSVQYGSEVSSSDLLPTYGATYGLHKLASLLFNPGSLVFCEETLYSPSAQILRDLGMKLIPIQMDSDGIIVDELEKSLERHMTASADQTLKSAYSAMLYIIPVLQNPTGSILSADRCNRIVKLARKYKLLVACDDVYNLYYCPDDDGEEKPARPPARIFSYDKRTDPDYGIGHVASIGTASKLLVPSLRIGWLEVPKYIIDVVVANALTPGAGSPAAYMQGILATAIKTGLLEKFIAENKVLYKARLDFTVKLLKKYLPAYTSYSIPKGGFFIWIQLPKCISTTRLSEICTEHRIELPPGKIFSVDGSADNCFRLCPSMSSEEELENAIKIIAEQIINLKSLADSHSNSDNGLRTHAN